MVQGQPRQNKICQTPSQPMAECGDVPSILEMVGSLKLEDLGAGWPGQKARLFLQNN
jgi:hypothetical protein